MMIKDKSNPAFPNKGIFDHERGMTLRQYAAIKLKVPDSGTDWLDDMILKSLKNDFAAKAMQGILFECHDSKYTAKFAYEISNAMLESRK